LLFVHICRCRRWKRQLLNSPGLPI
jgi:hypothetical protein